MSRIAAAVAVASLAMAPVAAEAQAATARSAPEVQDGNELRGRRGAATWIIAFLAIAAIIAAIVIATGKDKDPVSS